jgi:hypothetical protein
MVQGLRAPLQGSRLQPHIIVQEQALVCQGLVKEELPVFGKATPGQVPDLRNRPALRLEHPDHGSGCGVLPARCTLRLVADDHTERPIVLAGETGKGGGQLSRPVARWQQDVHCQWLVDGLLARPAFR